MAQYNSIDKKAVKALNQKQTVLIETVVEKGKTSKNVYLNNSCKRREAYYGIYVAEGFKPSKKKDEVQKSYQLLKLFKFIEAIGNAGAKEGIRFFQSEEYAPDPVKEVETPAEEVAPETTEE